MLERKGSQPLLRRPSFYRPSFEVEDEASGIATPQDNREGSPIRRPYTKIRPIGSGRFAQVFEGVDANGHPVAIKQLKDYFSPPKNGSDDPIRSRTIKEAIAMFNDEVAFLKTFDSKHAVRYYDSYTEQELADESSTRGYIILQLLDGTTVFNLITPPEGSWVRPELAEVYELLRQGSNLLVDMQARNMVHRDLGSQNMFRCEDGIYRGTDFQLAKIIEEEFHTPLFESRAGGDIAKAAYEAPELEQGNEYANTDIYSLTHIGLNWLRGRHDVLLPDDELTELPERFRAFLKKNTSGNPGKRSRDAREFKNELESIIGGTAITATSQATDEDEKLVEEPASSIDDALLEYLLSPRKMRNWEVQFYSLLPRAYFRKFNVSPKVDDFDHQVANSGWLAVLGISGIYLTRAEPLVIPISIGAIAAYGVIHAWNSSVANTPEQRLPFIADIPVGIYKTTKWGLKKAWKAAKWTFKDFPYNRKTDYRATRPAQVVKVLGKALPTALAALIADQPSLGVLLDSYSLGHSIDFLISMKTGKNLFPGLIVEPIVAWKNGNFKSYTDTYFPTFKRMGDHMARAGLALGRGLAELIDFGAGDEA